MTDDRRMVRQGDILLVPVADREPTGLPVAPEDGRYILARGEMTGHHHSVAVHDRIAMFREDGSGGGLLLLAGVPTTLRHQEHSALPVPAGAWEVRRQRTVTTTGSVRMVAD